MCDARLEKRVALPVVARHPGLHQSSLHCDLRGGDVRAVDKLRDPEEGRGAGSSWIFGGFRTGSSCSRTGGGGRAAEGGRDRALRRRLRRSRSTCSPSPGAGRRARLRARQSGADRGWGNQPAKVAPDAGVAVSVTGPGLNVAEHLVPQSIGLKPVAASLFTVPEPEPFFTTRTFSGGGRGGSGSSARAQIGAHTADVVGLDARGSRRSARSGSGVERLAVDRRSPPSR